MSFSSSDMHGYVMYHQGKKMLPASWVATVKVYGCGKERGSPWLGGGGGDGSGGTR